MAISLSRRRIVAVELEAVGGGARGTAVPPVVTASALPTIRDAKITRLDPIKVERPTLRLSLTGVPDIFPGQATVELTVLMEMGGLPANSAIATAQTGNFQSPVWSDIMRGSGFEEVSNQGSPVIITDPALSRFPRLYNGFTGMTAGNGAAMRHGETILVDYATGSDIGPTNTFVVGDTFADDDAMYIEEPSLSPTLGTGAITLTTTTSAKSTNAGTVVRRPPTLVAFRLQSNVNRMETITVDLYNDGKRIRVKGAMCNVEWRFNHGDVILAEVKVVGVLAPSPNGYADVAMPTNANELHNIPPKFLGKDVRLRNIAGTSLYGKDAGTIVGAINQLVLRTGNVIELRENSLDPAGVNFALITDRAPGGSFNPDEVSNAEFDFVAAFVAGAAHRLKLLITDVAASPFEDGNSFDFFAPGIVFAGLADQERNKINIWDASFDLTGGDYDTTAAGEIPGNDNELTLCCR